MKNLLPKTPSCRRLYPKLLAHRSRRLILESLEQRTLLAVALGGEFQVNSFIEDNQFLSAATMDAAGAFVVVWDSIGQDGDMHGVFGRRFDADGTPKSDDFQINTTTTGDQIFSRVSADGQGNFVVVWESDTTTNKSIFGQLYGADGVPVGGEFQVNTTASSDQLTPSVAKNFDGSFVVVWDSFGDGGSEQGILGQRFTADGNPMGDEFSVNSATVANRFFPDVTIQNDGSFMAVWESDGESGNGRDIVARRFDANGQPQGDEFQVNTVAARDQLLPAVDMNRRGQSVVVWTHQSDSGYDVLARRYDPDGNPLGDAIVVSQQTSPFRTRARVAVDERFNFVITWDRVDADGDGQGVLARRFNRNGLPLTDAWVVNSTTADQQSFADVADSSFGDFVVVWESFDQDGDALGIFGQRYLVNRPPVVDLNGLSSPGLDAAGLYIEADPPASIVEPDLAITDPDGTTIIAATAVITNLADAGHEWLDVNTTGVQIDVQYDVSTGTLNLSSAAPLPQADYEAVLQTLTYRNSSDDPTENIRTVTVIVDDGTDISDPAVSMVTVEALRTFSGYVYADVNNNGIRDPWELGLPNVPISIEGPVSYTVTTDAIGYYHLPDLRRGLYTVIETQPLAFVDGKETQGTPLVGTVSENRFENVDLTPNIDPVDYNFGERGLIPELVSKQLYLASSPAKGEYLQQLDVVGGTGWYVFQADMDSTLYVTAEAEDVEIQLYQSSMLPVAMSLSGEREFAAQVAESESYLLHVVRHDATDDFQVQLDFTAPYFDTMPTEAAKGDARGLDANHDGQVTPADALLVINALNRHDTFFSSPEDETFLDADVNRDGSLSPVNALLVINHLNIKAGVQVASSLPTSPPEATAEGEASSWDIDPTETMPNPLHPSSIDNYFYEEPEQVAPPRVFLLFMSDAEELDIESCFDLIASNRLR